MVEIEQHPARLLDAAVELRPRVGGEGAVELQAQVAVGLLEYLQAGHPGNRGELPLRCGSIRLREGDEDPAAAAQGLLQLRRAAVGDDFAVVDDRHPVAGRLGLAQDMGGEDDGLLPADAPDDFPDFDDLVGVQARGRLIQDQYFRIVHHGMRQPHALLVALGQLADRLVHDLVDAAQVAELADARTLAGCRHPPDVRDELEVVVDEHIVIQGCGFRQVPQNFFDFQGLLVDGIVFHPDAARGRFQKARQHAQGGGFSGPVRAQQPQNFALADIEGDVVHRAKSVVVFGQALDTNHGLTPWVC